MLMLSGVGDQNQLRRFGIATVSHLPGVGRNFQDHLGFSCNGELPHEREPTWFCGASLYWAGRSGLDAPDLYAYHGAFTITSAENAVRYGLPDASWVLFGALAHPQSRGAVELTGPGPDDPVRLGANGCPIRMTCDRETGCAGAA